MTTDKKTFLIVGLGNPGFRYKGTRHNIGFMILDEAAKIFRSRFHREGEAWVARIKNDDRFIVLVKPRTYMNRSGIVIPRLMQRYSVPRSNLLVVCDDVNLPLGKLRLRRKGRHGGQKGLGSVIQVLGTDMFPRLRAGIGPARGDMVTFVLSRFQLKDRARVRAMVKRAGRTVNQFVFYHIDYAMNMVNSSV